MVVHCLLFPSTTPYISPYYSSLHFFSSFFHLPSSLPAVTINFLMFVLFAWLYMWTIHYLQMSACLQVSVCVYNWMSSPSTSLFQDFYSCYFSRRSAPSSLPSNSAHLSFLLCFHFLSVLSLSLPLQSSSHIFLHASFLSSYYLPFSAAVVSHLSLVYLCLVPSLSLLC